MELGEPHAQRFGDGEQGAVGVAFAALDRAEVRAVYAGLVGEVLSAPGESLLIVDDVLHPNDLEPLRRLPPGLDVLLTAREEPRRTSLPRRFAVVTIPPLTDAEATDLLRRLAPAFDSATGDRLTRAASGSPLLLSALLKAAEASANPQESLDLLGALRRIVDTRAGRYFLDTDDPRVIAAWERAFTRLGNEDSTVDLADFERGSWRRSWRRRYTPVRIDELLDKAERAAEVAALMRPEADANRNNAEAIARLIEASTAIPNLVVLSGSVLVIKVTDGRGPRIVSKTLTASQLRAFEQNERLLSHPADALAFLASVGEEPPPALPATE